MGGTECALLDPAPVERAVVLAAVSLGRRVPVLEYPDGACAVSLGPHGLADDEQEGGSLPRPDYAQDWRRARGPLRCDLLVLVDQLDELFDPAVDVSARDAFLALLAALVATGRVWVAATLRDAFYPQVLASPTLSGLKERGASLDVAPPGAAELAEIVRAPAEAAGLVYDKDPASGEAVDQRILREADEPDMLPLVQLALTRLFEARETRGAETVLPLAAFEKLGGVKGIVEEAGETALAKLDETERGRLPALIRHLAEVSHGAALTARAAPLAEAAPDAPAKTLVDGLIAARLITLTGEGGGAIVRLAHQRVLADWSRAARIVADSADFYRVRDEVEDQRRRWEAGKRRGELMLARGLPLAEARDMAARYGAELPPATLGFIAASRRRAQAVAWAAGCGRRAPSAFPLPCAAPPPPPVDRPPPSPPRRRRPRAARTRSSRRRIGFWESVCAPLTR